MYPETLRFSGYNAQTPASSGATFKSQLISPSSPYLVFNHSFVFLKCAQSKKPLLALSGLGCGLFKTKCLLPLTPLTLCSAGLPQARKTTPRVRFAATVSMTFCVNFSQPFPACELAWCARTVRQVLRRSTPRSAQGVRRPPFFGGGVKDG